jgi:hypothetical protein
MKKPKKRKPTPLQERRAMVEKLIAAHEEFENKKLDAIEKYLNDTDKIKRAETDSSLSAKERLEIFKSHLAWPRIVLGIYEAELAIAQKERNEKGPPEYGRLEPSEIAADAVGRVVGLKRDRIFKIVNEGRQHIADGQPQSNKVNITAAEFEKLLSGHFIK